MIVGTLTIDLGPWVRGLAEREGPRRSNGRSISAGSASTCSPANSASRTYASTVSHAGDRPFFTAKQLDVALDWLPALGRHREFIITSVEMTDWQMLVEKWDGGHNFPKFTRDEPDKPPAEAVYDDAALPAGEARPFTYEDHEAPWSIVCPNLDIEIGNLPHYHGDGRVHRRRREDSGSRCRWRRT